MGEDGLCEAAYSVANLLLLVSHSDAQCGGLCVAFSHEPWNSPWTYARTHTGTGMPGSGCQMTGALKENPIKSWPVMSIVAWPYAAFSMGARKVQKLHVCAYKECEAHACVCSCAHTHVCHVALTKRNKRIHMHPDTHALTHAHMQPAHALMHLYTRITRDRRIALYEPNR
eukprot:1161659-Pelagomonas_calceolata.AAC.4